MLAEMVDHVIGIDPDRDWITAAIVDAKTTGVVSSARFTADALGYDDAIAWADSNTVEGERAWAVEGTGSYDRGVTAALSHAGEWVVEFDRPRQKASKDGAKSDELDAARAAREALGRSKVSSPRAHDGHREAIRVHTVARAGAVCSRTAAINELKALIVTAPDTLRSELRHMKTPSLVKKCAAFRNSPSRPLAQQCTRNTIRALARRIDYLSDEIAVHDTAIKTLIDQAAPQLLAETGIGYVTAAMFYIAWSHHRRCRNEAAYARLGGAAPIPATSGQNQTRHRLNPRGDRQLNSALYIVATTKLRCDPETRTYKAKRLAEGKTNREITRCLKRYIARRVWRLLEQQPAPPNPLDRT